MSLVIWIFLFCHHYKEDYYGRVCFFKSQWLFSYHKNEFMPPVLTILNSCLCYSVLFVPTQLLSVITLLFRKAEQIINSNK